MNVDLCFVPEKHVAQERLPAVSGSSGHLVVDRLPSNSEEPHWPGQIFAEAGLDYAEAMHQYAQTTCDRLVQRPSERLPTLQEPTRWRTEWEGRAERYRVREQRKREEVVWKAAKTAWCQTRQADRALTRSERKERRAAYQLACQAWKEVRQQRQATLQQRQQENHAWHQYKRQIKAGSCLKDWSSSSATKEPISAPRPWLTWLSKLISSTFRFIAIALKAMGLPSALSSPSKTGWGIKPGRAQTLCGSYCFNSSRSITIARFKVSSPETVNST